MFISLKKHKKILANTVKDYEEVIDVLREELNHARDLKAILEKLYPMYCYAKDGTTIQFVDASGYSLNLGENVAQYVDDLFGGKVIKQEATKAIEIDQKGNVKTGLTKQSADKGFSYKLIRK